MDEARVEGSELRPAESQAIEDARPVGLDEDVRRPEKCGERRLALGRLQVEADDGLAAVHHLVEGGDAVAVDGPQQAHGIAARRLHLHHLGTHVGKHQGGIWPRHVLGDVEDPHAFEEARRHQSLRLSRTGAHSRGSPSSRGNLLEVTGNEYPYTWVYTPRGGKLSRFVKVRIRIR